MQLLVLGMHRSGTSNVSRMLNLMGCYFGPEHLAISAPAEDPRGCWERRDVLSLNQLPWADAPLVRLFHLLNAHTGTLDGQPCR